MFQRKSDSRTPRKLHLKLSMEDAALLIHLVSANAIREQEKCEKVPGNDDEFVASEAYVQTHTLYERIRKGLASEFNLVCREHTEDELAAIKAGRY